MDLYVYAPSEKWAWFCKVGTNNNGGHVLITIS